jgi:hypothetical protein
MAHAYDAIVPLFLSSESDELCLVGSSVLVVIEEEYFLLTAAHVTDHVDESHFLFTPGNDHIIQVEGKFAQLGRAGERDEKASALDVAYYRLEQSFIERLSESYRPIDMAGIDMLDRALGRDLYSLAGYPAATSTVKPDSCAAEFFAMTGAVPHDRFYRKLGYRRDMHVLTQFNVRRNVMLRGRAKSTPEPWGMSGGGIFSWPRDANPLEPNPDPKLVGITTNWHQRHAIFAGTRIWCFLKCIAINNPSLIRLISVDPESGSTIN